ncbi:MAG: GNAT family N-acetyltransferase [Bacteroidetes bacterium]|nr:MAG: GNAT family N-acetyltransferase [Bacteroidota bacterium]
MWNSPTEPEATLLEAQAPPRRSCRRGTTPTPVIAHSVHTHSLSHGWQVTIYPQLAEGIKDWATVATDGNLFTSCEFLNLLADLELPGIHSGLAIFHHPKQGCFGLILQVFSFAARQQLGNLEAKGSGSTWQQAGQYLRRSLASWLNFRVLTAGQLLLTGDHHGLAGLSNCTMVSKSELSQLIDQSLEQVAAKWPQHIQGILLKDLPLEDTPRTHNYHSLPVQPNMLLHIAPQWKSMEDYMAAMSSKYRVRVRRARKKGASLQTKLLSLEELQAYQARMHALYRQVADQSEFNGVQLPPDYFMKWQQHFPEQVDIVGYFDGEKLVGFTSTIQNAKELEAHYLGLEAAYNPSHQLYLNMLYDMVDQAIRSRMERLVLSRTALEIKSSIGAVPQDLPCWLRGRKRWSTALIPLIAPYIAPPVKWTQRHPFK